MLFIPSALIIVFLLTVRSRAGNIRSRYIIYINFFLIDTTTFLFLFSFIIRTDRFRRFLVNFTYFLDNGVFHLFLLFLTLLIFFLSFLTLFFFAFFLRTSRLIQCIQIYLSDYIYFRNKLGWTDFKYFIRFICIGLLYFFHSFRFFFFIYILFYLFFYFHNRCRCNFFFLLFHRDFDRSFNNFRNLNFR